MKKYFKYLYILQIVITYNYGFTQISRTQIISNANSFTVFSWTATSCNIWQGNSCGGGNIYNAPWISGAGNYVALPYCWGGWSTLAEFSNAISNCKSAGQVCSSSGGGCSGVPSAPLSCAGGHDCSGLVSRAWERTSKYSTSTLPNISSSIPLSGTQPGDIVNVAGSHVRLIETNYGNGNYRVIEASGADWKVAYHTYTAIQLSSYDPRCANSNIVIGGCGTIDSLLCNNDNSCGPPNPIPLNINSTCVNTSCSTIGATAQSPDIPFYAGASCSTLYQSARTDDDVWFSITPGDTSLINISVVATSGNLDPCIGVYTGNCSSPTQIACADANGNMLQESVSFIPTTLNQYLIRVFGYDIGAYSGNFDICVTSSSNSSVSENFSNSDFKLYPNPASNFIILKANNNIHECYAEIINSEGIKLERCKLMFNVNNEANIDLTKYKSGLYLITLYLNNQIKSFKFQKQN